MRHQVYGRHLGRTSAHRTALKRNLASSLFEHGTIATTPQKAKFVKPFAEKMITLAKKGDLHSRRQVIAHLQNRNICEDQNGEAVKVNTVIDKLFNEIGPRFAQRNGGYTRIIRLPLRRIGDNGQLVFLQLVEDKAATPIAQTTNTPEPATEEAPAVTAEADNEPTQADESELQDKDSKPAKEDDKKTDDA